MMILASIAFKSSAGPSDYLTFNQRKFVDIKPAADENIYIVRGQIDLITKMLKTALENDNLKHFVPLTEYEVNLQS